MKKVLLTILLLISCTVTHGKIYNYMATIEPHIPHTYNFNGKKIFSIKHIQKELLHSAEHEEGRMKLNITRDSIKNWERNIIYEINGHQFHKVFNKLNDFRKYAFNTNDTYAVSVCYKTTARMHEMLHQYTLAIEEYERAMELDPEDRYIVLSRISKIYYETGYYDKAKEYIETSESEDNGCSPEESFYISTLKALIYIRLNNYENAKLYYNKANEYLTKYKLDYSNYYTSLKMEIMIHEGLFGKSKTFIDSLNDNNDKYKKLYIYYKNSGEYKKALEYYRMFADDSDKSSSFTKELAEFNATLNKEQMIRERQDLLINELRIKKSMTDKKAQNDSLALKNKMLEYNSQCDILSKKIIENKTNRNKKKALLAKYKLYTQKQKSEIMKNKAIERYNRITFSAIITILIFVSLIFIPLFIHHNKNIKYINKKNRELTDIKENLIKACKESKKADKKKSVFLQNLSHEVRTPLNAISGFSQLLADDMISLTEEEKTDMTRRIITNSELINELVNNVLILSELQNNSYEACISQANANALCEEVLIAGSHKCPERVSISFKKEMDDRATIATDIKMVERVLSHFVSNACKYTEVGSITIGCNETENPNYITFYVEDTGCGVSEENATIIFERFEKAGSLKQGNGLGLYIDYIIAQKLNARVKLDTRYKNGARFLLLLPIYKSLF